MLECQRTWALCTIDGIAKVLSVLLTRPQLSLLNRLSVRTFVRQRDGVLLLVVPHTNIIFLSGFTSTFPKIINNESLERLRTAERLAIVRLSENAKMAYELALELPPTEANRLFPDLETHKKEMHRIGTRDIGSIL